MKRCIFIIGMHRSGTSAVAGMLAKGGLCLGKNLLEADWVNQLGYFEDKEVIFINRLIYEHCGFDPWFPAHIDVKDFSDTYMVLFEEFTKKYQDVDLCALKDPRFCATFPVWDAYFTELGIETDIILTKRDPKTISRSIQRTRNIKESMADGSVITHLELIEDIKEAYPDKILYIVNYEKLIKEPRKIYNEVIAWAIGKKLAPDGYKFIDKTMKHF